MNTKKLGLFILASIVFIFIITCCNNTFNRVSHKEGKQSKFKNNERYTKSSEDSLTDIDGNTYPILHIGTQLWMGSNLRASKYNNGKLITKSTGYTSLNNTAEGQFVWYENDENYENPYGKLYNYYVVQEGNLCPSGWHIPSVEDWQKLIEFLGASTTDFNAQLGGYNDPQNIPPFSDIEKTAYWWTNTSVGRNTVATYEFHLDKTSLQKSGMNESNFLSVRCIKTLRYEN